MYSNVDVANSFKVPDHAPWPQGAWGQRLGHYVRRLRAGEVKLTGKQQLALKNMGFKWGPNGPPPSNNAQHPLALVPSCRSLQATYQEQIVHQNMVKEKTRLQLIKYHSAREQAAQEQEESKSSSSSEDGEESDSESSSTEDGEESDTVSEPDQYVQECVF